MPNYPSPFFKPVEITPDFWVTNQIFPAQFQQVKAFGFTRILSARPDEEEDETEQPPRYLLEQLATDMGLQFSHLPIESGAAFPESAIRGAAHFLSSPPQKTLSFCLTGIRSVRLWALGSALAEILTPKQIITATTNAGFDLSQFTSHLNRLAAGQAPFYVADDTANYI